MLGDRLNLTNRLIIVMALSCVIFGASIGYLYFKSQVPPETENGEGADGNLVGVIHIEGSITSSDGTGSVTEMINEAISNSSLKAVVLRIDSPGGYAQLVEQIYLDVLELRKEKPVVASVITALSGGYYVAVGAEYIYTHPSSMVGNVGVLGTGPQTLVPSELNLETGPYKVTGFSKLNFPFNLSEALESFAGAVGEGRGDRLKISQMELRKGKIYMGTEAVDAGLADALGGFQMALDHAASLAGLEEYEVVDVEADGEADGLETHYNGTAVNWRDLTLATLNEMNPPPAVYYLYLPPMAYEAPQILTTSTEDGEAETVFTKGQVIVDLSHGNGVSSWVFHLLSAELAMRGVYLGYGDTWEEVEGALDASSCLIVAAPTQSYSLEEFRAIEDFVNQGRMLLMFYDPAAEFSKATSPLGPINSLANRWGLSFGKGYLYNMEENYGIYRNIYVREFGDNNLTGGLDSMVLFTSTYLHSTDSDSAWTTPDTYSSMAERAGVYAPISVITKGNGTVAAFGDLSFMLEPYSYVEDNHGLILNLAGGISSILIPVVEEPEEPEYNITEPDLPVGTIKLYYETVEGEEQSLWWLRTAEDESVIERPDRVTTFHYNEEGELLGWEYDNVSLTYHSPVPDWDYPLTEGKAWSLRVGYTLTIYDLEMIGILLEAGEVVGFETVATRHEEYLCAKIHIRDVDELDRLGENWTTVVDEYVWVSSEVGTVRSESSSYLYVDGTFIDDEQRILMLQDVIWPDD